MTYKAVTVLYDLCNVFYDSSVRGHRWSVSNARLTRWYRSEDPSRCLLSERASIAKILQAYSMNMMFHRQQHPEWASAPVDSMEDAREGLQALGRTTQWSASPYWQRTPPQEHGKQRVQPITVEVSFGEARWTTTSHADCWPNMVQMSRRATIYSIRLWATRIPN